MKTLKLNYYELSDETRQTLAKEIKKYTNYDLLDSEIERLFEINNAGISIDIFPYLLGQK